MNEEIFKNVIGVIGAGHIGQALILKLLEKDFPESNIKLSYNGSIFTFSNLYDNNLVDMISDNSRIVKEASIIILSVPPQSFRKIGDFGLDDNTLVISFMAGISINTIKKQTGSNNVVRIIPTGPDTIKNSVAIAGTYPENDMASSIFDLLDFDCCVLDNENDMDLMVIAGCLPAVFCKINPDTKENIEDIYKFANGCLEFVEMSRKAKSLVPEDNKEEFIKNVSTPGGVTEAIINSIDEGKSLYESLIIGLNRNKELS